MDRLGGRSLHPPSHYPQSNILTNHLGNYRHGYDEHGIREEAAGSGNSVYSSMQVKNTNSVSDCLTRYRKDSPSNGPCANSVTSHASNYIKPTNVPRHLKEREECHIDTHLIETRLSTHGEDGQATSQKHLTPANRPQD